MRVDRVRKVTPDGVIETVAGGGDCSVPYAGDGGAATRACVAYPQAVAVGDNGDLFIGTMRRILKVASATGIITTVAGGSAACSGASSGDGAAAADACFTAAASLAVDRDGNILVADWAFLRSGRLRKIWASSGNITTVAEPGNCSDPQHGDGGPGTAACVDARGVTIDAAGDAIIADWTHGRVRKLSAATGNITTLAGNPNCSGTFGGDGGAAVAACLFRPTSVGVDGYGNILVADSWNVRVRKVWVNGTITTLAGRGLCGATGAGDGGAATLACVDVQAVAAYGEGGNALVVDGPRIRAIVVDSSFPCAAGFACPCGVPVPCADAASYCPANVVTPVPADIMYYTTPEGGAGRTGQQLCPPGSYCSAGVRHRCRPGTSNPNARQIDATACVRCPPASYSAVSALESSTGCLPCPRGAAPAAGGSAFCGWCAAGTHGAAGGGCEPCPNGTYSLGGPGACSSILEGMSSAAWDEFASLTVATKQPSTPTLTEWLLSAPVAAPTPIAVLAALPLLYVLITWCAAPKGAWHERILSALRSVDAFGLEHDVDEGQSPVMRNTAAGGAVTVLAMGTIAAMAAALAADYSVNNRDFQQPVFAPVTQDYADIAPTLAAVPHWSGVTSGVRIDVHAMGPLCAAASWAPPSFLGGSGFVYNVTMADDTAHAHHVFDCPDCAFADISTFDVAFDASCQTLLVHAFAVNTAGEVTAASFAASSACPNALDSCPRMTSAAVALRLTLDVLDDAVSGQATRGYLVSPTTAVPPANADSSVVVLRIALPLNPFYVVKQVEQQQTLVELASNIIGLAGLLGGFGWTLSQAESHLPKVSPALARASAAVRSSLSCRCTCKTRAGRARCAGCSRPPCCCRPPPPTIMTTAPPATAVLVKKP